MYACVKMIYVLYIYIYDVCNYMHGIHIRLCVWGGGTLLIDLFWFIFVWL